MVGSASINVPGDKITQSTLNCEEKKNNFLLKFVSLDTINILKVLTLKVTFCIRKRNGVLAQLSSSFILSNVDEEQKNLSWEVFGFASLISWTTQPVLKWKFRAYQTHGTASFRCASLRLLNQLLCYWMLKLVLLYLEIEVLSAFFYISAYFLGYLSPQVWCRTDNSRIIANSNVFSKRGNLHLIKKVK